MSLSLDRESGIGSVSELAGGEIEGEGGGWKVFVGGWRLWDFFLRYLACWSVRGG